MQMLYLLGLLAVRAFHWGLCHRRQGKQGNGKISLALENKWESKKTKLALEIPGLGPPMLLLMVTQKVWKT